MSEKREQSSIVSTGQKILLEMETCHKAHEDSFAKGDLGDNSRLEFLIGQIKLLVAGSDSVFKNLTDYSYKDGTYHIDEDNKIVKKCKEILNYGKRQMYNVVTVIERISGKRYIYMDNGDFRFESVDK